MSSGLPQFGYSEGQVTVQASKQTTIYWIIGALLVCCICYCCVYLSGSAGFLVYQRTMTPTETFKQTSQNNKYKRAATCLTCHRFA